MYYIFPMIFLTIVCLFYLVYEDLKTREINIIPVYFLSGIGFIYNIVFGYIYNFWKLYVLQLMIAIFFLLIIYVLGKITVYAYIGEGDLLTILMISLTSGYAVLFSEFVFLLALLFMLFVPIIFFFFNLFNKNHLINLKKNQFYIIFLGFPMSVSKINNLFTPLERYYIEGKKIKQEFSLKPDCEPEEQIKKLNSIFEKNPKKKIWVSPLIPFIWPIFIAYIFLTFYFVLNKLGLIGVFVNLYI